MIMSETGTAAPTAVTRVIFGQPAVRLRQNRFAIASSWSG